jgi:chromosome partitioning protein
MPVVSFVNQKGGCGKSTTALHFAYWMHGKSESVMVIDADTQRSSSVWLKEMTDLNLPCEIINNADDLLERIPEIAGRVNYVIVDGPAGLVEATRAILFRTDLAVIPCQPTGIDLRSATDAVRLIKQAQSVRGGPPQACAFVNRAVKGTKLKEESVAFLKKLPDLTKLATVIHQRQVVADASGQGCTVWGFTSNSATEAQREYDGLFSEINDLLRSVVQ